MKEVISATRLGIINISSHTHILSDEFISHIEISIGRILTLGGNVRQVLLSCLSPESLNAFITTKSDATYSR
jgi:hypothetical protein